ncbi:MAG: exodeoxyribonuclease VII large subunit [Gallionella sp.]
MTFVLFAEKKDQVFAVAELNFAIKQLLEAGVPLIWVRGEISNLVKAASGHFYFLLKDGQAQVRCVMFRHKNQLMREAIANGHEVEVLATATLYEQRGEFQLTVEQLRPAGLGALYEKFARLKQLLESQGLFAAARKRPLPSFPRRIGIVTSPQAAALRDVLTTLRRRLPCVPVVLYPTAVQGIGSAARISAAIEVANRRAECDVLILCRGGGSIEDLWAFNEEFVARAIVASDIPVVSGVGHETDFTIADFVADERAATPTAAAQRVVPDRHALGNALHHRAQTMQRAQSSYLQKHMQALDYLQRGLVHPAQRLQLLSQQLIEMQTRATRSFFSAAAASHFRIQSLAHRLTISGIDIDRLAERLNSAGRRLSTGIHSTQIKRRLQIDNAAQHLNLLDPRQVLARGYSMVQDVSGRVVSDAKKIDVASELRITFAQGWARTEVLQRGDGND